MAGSRILFRVKGILFGGVNQPDGEGGIRRQGVDKGIDAVGYQAVIPNTVSQDPAFVLRSLIEVVKAGGKLGIIGVYLSQDPGGVNEPAKSGQLTIPWGKLFEKGLHFGTGQCSVKLYNRKLRDLIIAGRAKPGAIVSHHHKLADAPPAYDKFDHRAEGYTKVVLHP